MRCKIGTNQNGHRTNQYCRGTNQYCYVSHQYCHGKKQYCHGKQTQNTRNTEIPKPMKSDSPTGWNVPLHTRRLRSQHSYTPQVAKKLAREQAATVQKRAVLVEVTPPVGRLGTVTWITPPWGCQRHPGAPRSPRVS